MSLSTASKMIEQPIDIHATQATSQHTRQVLLSCMIGNALEWYDFVIYGYFVVIFGAHFFPSVDPMTQILASWGIFWTGFIARPLGSLVFGHIGDKVSRKQALTLSIFMMAIPTTLMGCLPTYAQIGIFAPILLIVLRTLQGFAIGGEFTGSMVFLVEHGPENKRGFWGSWASFSAVIGVIIGSCLVAALNHHLTPEMMLNWGWRIPFLISVLGSVVGIYIRMHLTDPSVYLKVKARKGRESVPLKDLFSHYKAKIGVIFLLDFLTAIGFFIIAIFLATYFKIYLKLPEHIALSIHTLSMMVFAVAILIGGWASDKIGRKSILGLACSGFILFAYPLFLLFQTNDLVVITMVESTLAFMFGLFFGVIPTTLSEMMPTTVRFSGLSIGHNMCMAIVGGGTPFLATHIIKGLDDMASPAYLLIFAAIVSLSSLCFFKDKYRSSLDE